MKKSIFLTGSKGFIGRHLLKVLTDYEVYCAGRNELPNKEYDYTIHLAATTTLSQSFYPELFENNVVYAKQIMGNNGRIIYASSTSASELINPYAYTKRYIEYLGEMHGNATGLRLFNVYGNGNNKGIVKKAIECANSGAKLSVMNGFQIRDFIYIDDVVNCIVNSLDENPGVIDVGTGNGISIFNALNTIERVIGRKINKALYPHAKTDMEYSVANPGLPNCLSFENGLIKMLGEL